MSIIRSASKLTYCFSWAFRVSCSLSETMTNRLSGSKQVPDKRFAYTRYYGYSPCNLQTICIWTKSFRKLKRQWKQSVVFVPRNYKQIRLVYSSWSKAECSHLIWVAILSAWNELVRLSLKDDYVSSWIASLSIETNKILAENLAQEATGTFLSSHLHVIIVIITFNFQTNVSYKRLMNLLCSSAWQS